MHYTFPSLSLILFLSLSLSFFLSLDSQHLLLFWVLSILASHNFFLVVLFLGCW